MRPRYRVALTQSRIRSRVGSSHPCHMILRKAMLTSSHLNRNLSICRRRRCFCRRCRYHPFFARYFHPWKCGLLSSVTRVLLCPLGMKVTNPHLLRQSQYLLWKLRSDTSDILGGGWPDDVRFPRRSEDSPPLVVVWAEDVSIMLQA